MSYWLAPACKVPGGLISSATTPMKIQRALVMAVILAAGLATAVAVPMESTRRIIGGTTVDLAPLIKWERSQKGDRPLTNCFHIKGTLQTANAMGWVMQADLGGEPGKPRKIILKNGPSKEVVEFERLDSELKSLQRQQTQLERSASRPVEDRLVRTSKGIKKVRDPKRDDVAAAKSELKQVKARIKELEQQTARYPSKDGRYLVDCFAFRTGQVSDNLPVYDCGYVAP